MKKILKVSGVLLLFCFCKPQNPIPKEKKMDFSDCKKSIILKTDTTFLVFSIGECYKLKTPTDSFYLKFNKVIRDNRFDSKTRSLIYTNIIDSITCKFESDEISSFDLNSEGHPGMTSFEDFVKYYQYIRYFDSVTIKSFSVKIQGVLPSPDTLPHPRDLSKIPYKVILLLKNIKK